jgi:hypothetical protein
MYKYAIKQVKIAFLCKKRKVYKISSLRRSGKAKVSEAEKSQGN